MLDAFSAALAFGRRAVLITDHSSSVHGRRFVKCFVVRHEIVVRILWREGHGIALGNVLHI
ncbi:hypothetical protein IR009_02970 [Pseudomonas putida]|uniref:hypothetical protein n=1 Tax=Pseudomonas putida TaxID=303 RepID=UPI0018A8A032|nr:hypothetical protein [Pseudomonas putida]MBF8764182.1 hypothetical protein [Pseudomonas putida]